MKYETIGGAIKDTSDNLTTLRFLRVGDKFRIKSSGSIFEVRGEKCIFNPGGSPLRRCKNLTSGGYEFKLCRTTVIKVKS